MKEITLIVRPDGSASLETRGYAGPACREASRFLEEALGCRTSEQLTGEFYSAVSSQSQNTAESA